MSDPQDRLARMVYPERRESLDQQELTDDPDPKVLPEKSDLVDPQDQLVKRECQESWAKTECLACLVTMDQVDVMVFLEKRETEVFPESPCLDVKDESVTLVVKDSLEMLVLPEARDDLDLLDARENPVLWVLTDFKVAPDLKDQEANQ